MVDKIEACFVSPPDKVGFAVELFVKNGNQWGEIDQENGELEIEICTVPGGQTLRFNLEELETVIDLAKKRLKG